MGNRLIGLDRLPDAPLGGKNHAMEGQSVHKLKVKFPAFGEIQRGDAKFFLGLADGSLQRGFLGLQAAAWTVDLPGTKAPLFSDHEDLTLTAHKTERGPHRRLPILPGTEITGIHGEEINLELKNSGRIENL